MSKPAQTKVFGRTRAAPAPPPVSATPASGKAVTSLHIAATTLADLKKLAADRRCRVNDLVVRAIDEMLVREGR